jgi:hypothetical protein
LIKSFAPLPSTLSLALPATAHSDTVLASIANKLSLSQDTAQLLQVTRRGGQSIQTSATLASLAGSPVRNAFGQAVIAPLTLEVRVGLKGGKGGFGSMLRAQGGKMSSNRNGEENNDSCRDLNGRRLSTVKQARQLALYLSTQAEREKELSDAQKLKYAKLEKMLGRKPKGESDFVEAAQRLHEQGGSLEEGDEEDDNRGGGSSSSSVPRPKSAAAFTNAEYKGKKRDRIEDSAFIEESREIVDNVRSAVAMAMQKKKKKQKMAATSSTKAAPPAQAV